MQREKEYKYDDLISKLRGFINIDSISNRNIYYFAEKLNSVKWNNVLKKLRKINFYHLMDLNKDLNDRYFTVRERNVVKYSKIEYPVSRLENCMVPVSTTMYKYIKCVESKQSTLKE